MDFPRWTSTITMALYIWKSKEEKWNQTDTGNYCAGFTDGGESLTQRMWGPLDTGAGMGCSPWRIQKGHGLKISLF